MHMRKTGSAKSQPRRKPAPADVPPSLAQPPYRELIECLDAIFWEADAHTLQFSFVSRQAERLLGYPIERWRGGGAFWESIIHPEDREFAVSYCRTATEQARNHDFNYRIITADERTVWIRDIVYVAKDTGGRASRLRGVMVDITAQKQAEEAVRQSASRLRLLQEQMPAILWTTDLNLRITSSTGAGLAALELRPGQTNGMRLQEYLQTEDPDFVPLAAHYRALAGESPSYESEWAGRFYQVHIEPLRDGEGRIMGVIGLAFDCTERKQAVEALRRNEAWLRWLIEQLPAIIWTVDPELRFTASMGAGLQALELRPNEVNGLRLQEYFQNDDPNFLPIQSARKALQGETATYEIPWKHRTFHSHVEPLSQTDGRIVGAIGVALDITERKQAENALRRERDFNSAILDTVGALVVVFDPEGRIVRFNRACEQVTRYTCEEVQGQPFWELFILPEEMAGVRAAFQELKGGAFPNRHENHWRTKDGQRRLIAWSNTALVDDQGAVTYVIGTGLDITEQRRAERQRELLFAEVHAGREQLQFLSRRLVEVQETERHHLARELHDEIGQSLTGLRLMLEMAGNPKTDDCGKLAEAHELVKDLMGEIRNLSLHLRPAMLDDLGLLPALLWLFDRYKNQTGVRVRLAHCGLEQRFAPEIETAAYRIMQEALTNVARHAQVDEVTVRLWADSETLVIQAQDHGVGFDPQAMLVPASANGLAGMRERARLLGGNLTVDASPGGGTRLTAELPLQPDWGGNRHALDDHARR